MHKDLESWQKKSLAQQMADIGSEVHRAINWKEKQNKEYSKLAFVRSLELIDASLLNKSASELKEILRVREVFADYFIGENIFKSTKENWEKYFMEFSVLVRR